MYIYINDSPEFILEPKLEPILLFISKLLSLLLLYFESVDLKRDLQIIPLFRSFFIALELLLESIEKKKKSISFLFKIN